jgi:hypothetical protein
MSILLSLEHEGLCNSRLGPFAAVATGSTSVAPLRTD